jgi:membrane carboxypeptidase/penicillin-binding protein
MGPGLLGLYREGICNTVDGHLHALLSQSGMKDIMVGSIGHSTVAYRRTHNGRVQPGSMSIQLSVASLIVSLCCLSWIS